MRLRRNRIWCRQERPKGRGWGPRPRQVGRLPTEAAGAEGVVDRSPSSETGAASRRSTHEWAQLSPSELQAMCRHSTDVWPTFLVFGSNYKRVSISRPDQMKRSFFVRKSPDHFLIQRVESGSCR